MTGNDEELSIKAIEIVRDLMRKAAVECEKRGISLEDVAVAALYASVDIAQRYKGDPFGAVEWMRTGLDLMERQLMDRASKASRLSHP